MNRTFFKALLELDSTTGRERETALWLLSHLDAPAKQTFETADGNLNLLLAWGTPRVVFCTHMDTVPPYIPPVFSEEKITGRGTCDAKGQILALYTACEQLEAEGCTDFGLLLLFGEETGSWGAKAFSQTGFQAPYLIVGEPTENKLVSASKGTLSYDLTFCGEAFHSGYPQFGVSAVDLFNKFYNLLKVKDFGMDPVLGETTWNVGLLRSDNPQNILSPELTCRLYFRTTFVSHDAVQQWMAIAEKEVFPATLTVVPRGGDVPARYLVPEGFPSAPVAFGSDAPHLTGFQHKIICGPGSIRYAHRPDEHILPADLEAAACQYVRLFHAL